MKKNYLLIIFFLLSSALSYFIGYKGFGIKYYTSFKCNYISGESKNVYCSNFSYQNTTNVNIHEQQLKKNLLENYDSDLFTTSLNKKYFINALGINNIPDFKEIKCKKSEATFEECYIQFGDINKIYFYKINNNYKKTIVLLHGQNTVPSDIFKNDKIKKLSQKNNIIVFSSFTNANDAQIISDILYLQNQNYYGLYVKSICEVLKLNNSDYYIIGHSNGALISKFLNSYCQLENIKVIIYNDYFPFYKNYFKKRLNNPIQNYTYEIKFLLPLYFYYSDAFFLLSGNSKTIIYQKNSVFENSQIKECLMSSKKLRKISNNDVTFISNTMGHYFNFALISSILEKENISYEKFILDKNCLRDKIKKTN